MHKLDIFDDDKFIEFVMSAIEEQSKGVDWNGVSWDHTESRYKMIVCRNRKVLHFLILYSFFYSLCIN